MMTSVSQQAFEAMIDDALDEIPEAFARHMTNMVVLARDFNEDNPTLLGLFEGVPLTEQHANHAGFLPDAIFVYKNALEAMCGDEEELRQEVRVTLLHEVGHYFGLKEDELHELGWG